MKKLNQTLLMSVIFAALSLTANAHDPKLHAKKAEKANCTPLEKMKKENKKIDMTDPVILAMIIKCEKQAKSKITQHQDEHSKQANQDKINNKKMKHNKSTEKKESEEHKH